MTISVYYAPPRTSKRTNASWCVTTYNGKSSVTERFEDEAEARAYAARLQGESSP